MTDDKLRAALERIRDHGYQPMYNGRPSCPFCFNFVDDEETHRAGCILRAALAASATDEGPTTSDLGSEYGRLLAERDRLIAAGVDPSALEVIDSMARPAVPALDMIASKVTALAHLTPEDWAERRGADPIARTINAVLDIIREAR